MYKNDLRPKKKTKLPKLERQLNEQNRLSRQQARYIDAVIRFGLFPGKSDLMQYSAICTNSDLPPGWRVYTELED